jgi:hypothetical protein
VISKGNSLSEYFTPIRRKFHRDQIFVTMNTRRKAKDFLSPEPVHGPSSASNTPVPSTDNSAARRHSARLESRTSAKSPVPKPSLEQSQSAKGGPRVSSVTPVPTRMRTRKLSVESHSTDEVFVDAKDVLSPVTPSIYPNLSVVEPNKTPGTARTEDSYSAVGSVNGKKRKISRAEGESTAEAEDVFSDGSTPGPSTQNTLINIPSSQPRPRSQRSPLPLQPVPSSPVASLPPSTSSEGRSTFDSITVLPLPKVVEPEDSDDEAPEAISLSTARAKAVESQRQIAQKAKAEAEKAREKRRQQDRLLAAQKQEKQERLKLQIEAPNSQQSLDVINSGNTTDTPAPNQDHQAARVARYAEVPTIALPTALPTSILQAASKTWLQPEPILPTQPTHTPKKRKERDDGVRILEEINVRLAPKAGKIGLSKEEMIMRMGRGERKMYIGRFAR